jgi:hypothetical protein
MDKIKKQETAPDDEDPAVSPLLQGLKHKNVFEVPEGYFNGLADNIAGSLYTREADILPTILHGLQHKNVFEVPVGYFEGLSTSVITKLQSQGARVVTMRQRLFGVAKYAVAAAFVGVMALGAYKIIAGGSGNGSLSNVQKEGIALSMDESKFNSAFEQVSDDAIVKFLETGGQDVDAALVAAAVDEKELPTEDELMLDDKTLDNFLNDIDNKDLNN